MGILGIESSTMVASAAIIKDGTLVGECVQNINKTHSQRLLPVIHQLLEESGLTNKDLKGIAVSIGPGSFTGLRIGMATAKALAQVWNIALLGIPTLDGLAQSLVYAKGVICPLLDAQKGQVYTRLFQGTGRQLNPLTDPMIIPFSLLLEQLVLKRERIYFLGTETNRYMDEIKYALGDQAVIVGENLQLPRAGNIAHLGEQYMRQGKQNDLFLLRPLYIKKSQAEVVWEKRREAEKHGNV